MIRKKLLTVILAIALCMGMAAPAYAVYDPMEAMMEASRRAVAAAIKAGTIPADATIYDCAYSTDANGVTIVVRYKDKDGKWIDIVAQKKAPSATTKTTLLTDQQLEEYAQEVFRLVNEERENVGLEPLERDSLLDEAAGIRATECVSQGSIRVDGQAHTRPDGTEWDTVLDEVEIEWSSAGENTSERRKSPADVMKAWMASKGHRKNILTEKRTQIGIAVQQASDGALYWVQLFIKP
jgi:uncharacterized protein YkwD